MSVIFHMLKDEYARLQDTQRAYEALLEKLPHGSKQVKHIRNGDYLYLAQHLKAGWKSKYIGPLSSEKAEKILKSLEKRKRYTRKLRETKAALKDVKQVLRGKL